MPSGGGKSTSGAAGARRRPRRILSEDSPLLDRSGRVHPFPMRIGVNPTDASLVPEGLAVRRQERIEFHPKLALDVEAWADRVEPRPQPLRNLVIGRRTLDQSGPSRSPRRDGSARTPSCVRRSSASVSTRGWSSSSSAAGATSSASPAPQCAARRSPGRPYGGRRCGGSARPRSRQQLGSAVGAASALTLECEEGGHDFP